MREFPLGRAPLVMIVLFIGAASLVLARPRQPAHQLDFWVFATTHYEEYKQRAKLFEEQHPGIHVRLQMMQNSVLRDKLVAAFLSETAAPDLAEIEIGDIGRFFQGRTSDIGFSDLTDRLQSGGWLDKLPRSRLAPYTNRGNIYGVPHDIHPVVLFYRDDLFRKAGIDLPKEAQTWDDFFKILEKPGLLDSRKDGRRDRYGLMLQPDDFGHYRLMLLQQGQDFFDEQDRIMIESPTAVKTLAYYAEKWWRDHVIFAQPPNWGPDMYGPMKEDRLCAVLAPDWYVGLVKQNAPELAGKWRAMPLPAWTPGGLRTSTWGGTMIGMPKLTKDPNLAWELLKFLYFDRDACVNRYEKTRILPPLKDAWSAPIFSAPDPYAGGQPMGKLFVDLIPSVPPVRQGKYLSEAAQDLKTAIYACCQEHADPAAELHKVADKVRQRQREDRFAN